MSQVRRLGSAASALALFSATAASTLLLIASPANAQASLVDVSLPPVEEVSDTTSGVGDAVGDTTSGVGDAVGDTTSGVGSTVGETVKDTGGKAGDAIEETGSKVGDAVGGPVGGAVKDTTKTGGGLVKDTTGKVGDAITETSGSTAEVIKETAETVGRTGSGLLDGSKPDGGSIDDPDRILGGTPGIHKGFNSPATDSIPGGGADLGSLGSSGSFALANSIEGLEFGDRAEFVDAAVDGRSPLELDQFVQEVITAAKQFVFPLILTLMVVAYMVAQGRFDSRDPKLAVAAVDADQDLLNFS